MSPTTSREFERTLPCGRSCCMTSFGLRGSVTSRALKLLGADSCASHRMRRPSFVACMPMPSPMPPKTPSSCWASNFMLSDSVFDACAPRFSDPLIAILTPFVVAVCRRLRPASRGRHENPPWWGGLLDQPQNLRSMLAACSTFPTAMRVAMVLIEITRASGFFSVLRSCRGRFSAANRRALRTDDIR